MNWLTSSTTLATTGDRQDDAAFGVDARPDRRDPHVVGQRRLELVEQLGPRERPPIDQLVGLARLGRRRSIALGSTLARTRRGLRLELGGARLVARRLSREPRVAP